MSSIFNQRIEQQCFGKKLRYEIVDKNQYNFKNPMEIKITKSSAENAVDFTFEQESSTNSESKNIVGFTFNRDELELLLNELTEVKDKLLSNTTDATSYSVYDMEDVYCSIIDNYFNYSFNDKAVSKPRLTIFREKDKVYFTVVDFANNKILLNQEIHLENANINLSINGQPHEQNEKVVETSKEITTVIISEIMDYAYAIYFSQIHPHIFKTKNGCFNLDIIKIQYIIESYVTNNLKIDNNVFIFDCVHE